MCTERKATGLFVLASFMFATMNFLDPYMGMHPHMGMHSHKGMHPHMGMHMDLLYHRNTGRITFKNEIFNILTF